MPPKKKKKIRSEEDYLIPDSIIVPVMEEIFLEDLPDGDIASDDAEAIGGYQA